MFSATVITGISMKCWWTIPTPASIAALRRAEPDRLALDQDLALVRVVQPVEDVHQRRLAGAVLAEQRVHLAFAEVEADVVVRDDARKALRDVAHLEDGPLVAHRPGDSMERTLRRAQKRDGRARGPARRRENDATSLYLTGALTLPAAICLETAVSFAIRAARFGALTLTLPKPTPPFLTVKTPSVPPLNVSSTI